MERESFEDEAVAELLNKYFVSIKVDREERPDIDHIYMRFCQVMTGQGGWPLTIVMTPNQEPFYAATYIPKERRYGRAGLLELLPRIADQWDRKKDELVAWSQNVSKETNAAFNRVFEGGAEVRWIDEALETLTETFDGQYGGFGNAPKFPSPHQLMFLLRQAVRKPGAPYLEMVTRTLDGMRQGGIYDHVGGGFARYSTDERWLVPHFEKMLYDNALLAIAYSEAYQVTRNELYAETTRAILTYLDRDMTSEEGAYTSAEDADSEGEEGKFYVWTPEEVIDILGPSDGTWYCEQYDITAEGNFEGKNIPNLIGRLRLHEDSNDARRAARCNEKLLAARLRRVRPHRDDKVLTGWNGLMMVALVTAGRALQDDALVAQAVDIWHFIQTRLMNEDGRLLARYRDGDAAHLGYLDDYAFVVWGLIELYQATFELEYLEQALAFQRDIQRLFHDDARGGYYFTGSDAEKLLTRPKEIYDGALPSGNSVTAYNAIRLARLTGDEHLDKQVSEIFDAFAADVGFAPEGHTFLLLALDLAATSSKELVLSVEDGVPSDWKNELFRTFRPNLVTLVRSVENADRLAEVVPFTSQQTMVDGQPTAYLCEKFACRQPTTDWNEVMTGLQS